MGFAISRVFPQLRNGKGHATGTVTRESMSRDAVPGSPDGRWRSIIKALSWRVVASAVTVIVVWLATGRMEVAAGVGAGDALIKIFLYYLHERAWIRIGFGQSTQRIGS